MQRRKFLKSSAGAGALAGLGFAGLTVDSLGGKASSSQDAIAREGSTGQIGRPVRVVSIGFKARGRSLEESAKVVDSEGSRGADLIALPEAWRGQNDQGSEETLSGPTITAIAALAKKHRTYIVCPIDRKDGKQRFNSAVLLDREGQVVSVYNKVFPWFPEYRLTPPVEPGQEVPVHQADFGRVGLTICFDVDFPEVWKRLADQGTELVIWSSAGSGGKALQAHAINYHYYIVSSTQTPDCEVYDITGEEIHYRKSADINVSRITLDLDRGIYNADSIEFSFWNIAKRDKLLKEHGADVAQEKYLERDDWFVLRAKRPGVSARELARSYSLEELRDFMNRSRLLIDKRRGWEFAEKGLRRSQAS